MNQKSENRKESIDALANKFMHALYEGYWQGEAAPPITSLSIAEAYQVQDLVADMRIQRGEEIVGFKVGCTSDAIRTQFGLSEPISGRLFKPYIHEGGSVIDWNNYVDCAIEPEMVLVIGEDLSGLELSDDCLINAIEYVSPGIELHNYRFWYGQASIQELICSGGIHAGLVVGNSKFSPKKFSYKDELFSVYKDEKLITDAPAREIMGGPIHSLRWLVDSLTQRGSCLKMGSYVIPGSPVELIRIEQNCELKVEIEGFGSVLTHFTEGK
ncbi:MAG: 2-keto-4-pentenoate hydratase [Pseudomonadales bacterium]